MYKDPAEARKWHKENGIKSNQNAGKYPTYVIRIENLSVRPYFSREK